MGNKNGTKDQNSRTRHEKERCDSDTHSGGSRDVGRESKGSWYQPERADREDSQRANNFHLGNRTDGGVVDQLIEEYQDQVAVKKAAIRTLELEIQQIETRIQQFESVREQLQTEAKQAS